MLDVVFILSGMPHITGASVFFPVAAYGVRGGKV
jgi:hypothetical protein